MRPSIKPEQCTCCGQPQIQSVHRSTKGLQVEHRDSNDEPRDQRNFTSFTIYAPCFSLKKVRRKLCICRYNIDVSWTVEVRLVKLASAQPDRRWDRWTVSEARSPIRSLPTTTDHESMTAIIKLRTWWMYSGPVPSFRSVSVRVSVCR